MVLIPKSVADPLADPLPVEIDAPIPVPTSITGQPISVSQTVSPLPVIIPTPVPVTQTVSPLPVIIPTPVPVTQTVSPLPVIIPTPVPVTQTVSPLPIDISAQSFSPLVVTATAPVGTPAGQTIVNETNLAIVALTDMFVDVSPTGTSAGESVIFRILFSAIEGGILRFTLNGVDFVAFDDLNAVKEDSIHLFDVVVDNADIFNLQYEKTTTVTFLRVVQLI